MWFDCSRYAAAAALLPSILAVQSDHLNPLWLVHLAQTSTLNVTDWTKLCMGWDGGGARCVKSMSCCDETVLTRAQICICVVEAGTCTAVTMARQAIRTTIASQYSSNALFTSLYPRGLIQAHWYIHMIISLYLCMPPIASYITYRLPRTSSQTLEHSIYWLRLMIES
jgi:hypothetical protein